MKNDIFLKKLEILPILKICKNKLYELINSGEFIEPVFLPGVKRELYSYNELQQWMEVQKAKRNKNPLLKSPNIEERVN